MLVLWTQKRREGPGQLPAKFQDSTKDCQRSKGEAGNSLRGHKTPPADDLSCFHLP